MLMLRNNKETSKMIRLDFNNLFVSTHGDISSITSEVVINDQIKSVVFHNGININFIRDLLHFQANIPRVYSKHLTMSHRLPFHELNSNAVITTHNTGNRRLQLHSTITVVPPIVQNRKSVVVYVPSIDRQFHPIMTVDKHVFEKHLNELLLHLQATDDMLKKGGDLITSDGFKTEIINRLQENLVNNFIWLDIVNAVVETLNMQRDVNKAVWTAITTIMRYWMNQFNTTIGMISRTTGTFIDELLGYITKIDEDCQIEDVESVDTDDDRQKVAKNFKALILRNVSISRLVEHIKEINLISIATVREASKKIVDPGEKMTIVLT